MIRPGAWGRQDEMRPLPGPRAAVGRRDGHAYGVLTLRVLTWNLGRIHLGARLNGWLGHDSRADDGALAHVARVVRRAGADVVAVQELRSEAQLGRLAAALGEPWRAAGALGSCDRMTGLLMRAPEGPKRMAPSSVTLGGGREAAALWEPVAGVWTVSVHLEAFDAAARAAQLAALLRWTDDRAGTRMIVAGDFNFDPAHPVVARASDRILLEALAKRGFVDVGATSGATALFSRRLDYVFVRGARPIETRVLRRRRVRLGDHDPLLARLHLPPRAGHSID